MYHIEPLECELNPIDREKLTRVEPDKYYQRATGFEACDEAYHFQLFAISDYDVMITWHVACKCWAFKILANKQSKPAWAKRRGFVSFYFHVLLLGPVGDEKLGNFSGER